MGDHRHSSRVYEEIGKLTLREQLQALGTTLQALNHWFRKRLPVSLTTEAHSFRPGDSVWVKEWNVQPLKPLWRGPFTVILFTLTAVKVAEMTPWIHHSRLKPVAIDWECISDSTEPLRVTLRKTLTEFEDRKNIGSALVTPEADQSTRGRSLKMVTSHQDGQCTPKDSVTPETINVKRESG